MSLICWLVIGVLAGLVAHAVTDGRRGSRLGDGLLGAGGATGGGLMFWAFGGDVRSFDPYSMVVAAIGAAVVLLSYLALFVYPGDRGD